ncbi:MAG: hypothetical protein M1457_11745 [bacterium]|nr:hypothetical protein [bacterium]
MPLSSAPSFSAIRERLEQWAEGRPGAAVTVCLTDLQEPARVRVLWLARRDSAAVVKACT